MQALTALTLAGAVALTAFAGATTTRSIQAQEKNTLKLGNFSVSLAVKDIEASKAFYDESTEGPASFVIADPDGNMILVDQHVPSPQR